MVNIGVVLSKRDFQAVFKTAWTKVATLTTATNAFWRAGMCSFSVIHLTRPDQAQIAAPPTPRTLTISSADPVVSSNGAFVANDVFC